MRGNQKPRNDTSRNFQILGLVNIVIGAALTIWGSNLMCSQDTFNLSPAMLGGWLIGTGFGTWFLGRYKLSPARLVRPPS